MIILINRPAFNILIFDQTLIHKNDLRLSITRLSKSVKVILKVYKLEE